MATAQQGPAKLAAVKSLVGKLREDLRTQNLTTEQRDSALDELKVYGREPRNADPLYTKEGIDTLLQYAFSKGADSTAKCALRVLCNALVLKEQTRQLFVDLGYEDKACEKLKNDDRDDEFLVSRLLFLTTYGTTVNLTDLIEKHNLAETIAKNLERHATARSSGAVSTNPMEEMAMTETLKLLFNITHFATAHTAAFTPVVPHVINLLLETGSRTPRPLDPPVSFLVNSLLNLDLGSAEIQSSLYPEKDPERFSNRLVDLLAKSSTSYNDMEYDVILTPLLGVVRGIHEYAPGAVKVSLRSKLLPAEQDRTEVLGKSASLSSWLLKNTTNPLAPRMGDVISDLLYDMSDKDATTFVDNVGYGFASGYLFSKNIPLPPHLVEGGEAGKAGAAQGSIRPTNPITGQFLDRETEPEAPEMTDEEKEREAERLFVLFERLRANGVISAENPVRTAIESGRFEELDNDNKKDVDSDGEDEKTPAK